MLIPLTKQLKSIPFKHFFAILGAVRIKEIVLMTGFSLVGILFTDTNAWFDLLKDIQVFAFILFYVMAVFFLNSYAGYQHDLISERLKTVSKVSKANYLYLLCICVVLFGIISYGINIRVFCICIASFFFWGMYYLPPIHLKSRLFGGTLIHFIAGVLHFHMGYVSFENANGSSLAISIFFTLLLCMGHFNHEMLDYKSDLFSGIKTTTVRMGIKVAQHIRTAAIVLTLTYLTIIYGEDYITAPMYFIYGTFILVLLFASIKLGENGPEKFMKMSRACVFLASMLYFISRLFI